MNPVEKIWGPLTISLGNRVLGQPIDGDPSDGEDFFRQAFQPALKQLSDIWTGSSCNTGVPVCVRSIDNTNEDPFLAISKVGNDLFYHHRTPVKVRNTMTQHFKEAHMMAKHIRLSPKSLDIQCCDDDDCEHCVDVKKTLGTKFVKPPKFLDPIEGSLGEPDHFPTYLESLVGNFAAGIPVTTDEKVHRCYICEYFVTLTAATLKLHMQTAHNFLSKKKKIPTSRTRQARGITKQPAHKKQKSGRVEVLDGPPMGL